ncbi:hypothetical protein EZS27_004702 [termite gut metagenome]|uniref:Uncharacterized protein n=1 Tax=termite gut metagenome TaxID=433724 RepID=A0A5J4SPC0_9ZZZZ
MKINTPQLYSQLKEKGYEVRLSELFSYEYNPDKKFYCIFLFGIEKFTEKDFFKLKKDISEHSSFICDLSIDIEDVSMGSKSERRLCFTIYKLQSEAEYVNQR